MHIIERSLFNWFLAQEAFLTWTNKQAEAQRHSQDGGGTMTSGGFVSKLLDRLHGPLKLFTRQDDGCMGTVLGMVQVSGTVP